VVDLVQFPALDQEDCDLRGDGCMRKVNEGLAGIEDGVGGDGVVAIVAGDDLRRIAGVGIDPPEADVASSRRICGELLRQAADLRDVAVGNGAIARREEEHDNAGTGTGQGGDWMSMRIGAKDRRLCGLRLGSDGKQGGNQRQRKEQPTRNGF